MHKFFSHSLSLTNLREILKMGTLVPELSLLQTTKPSFVPKLITDFLSELALIDSSSERSSRVDEFMNRLNEEKSKIEMLKRELPLSTLLFNEVIEAVNKELIHYKETTCEDEKTKWMSSFQLWTNGDSKKSDFGSNRNQNSSPQQLMGVFEERNPVADDPFSSTKNMAGTEAFLSFQGFQTYPTMAQGNENNENGLSSLGFSYYTPETLNPNEVVGFRGNSVSLIGPSGASNLPAVPLPMPPQQQQVASRKQRRCWSLDLHKRFVHCLQQLGVPQDFYSGATPKQIKELMKVEGLTNDEVKSHLQKYRIHLRRISNGRTNSENGSSMEYSDFQLGDSSYSSSPGGPLLSNNTNVVANSLNGDEEVEGYLHRRF